MLEINLTLPVMMVMFLLFAIAMNAVFFSPVLKALEARQAHIAEQKDRASQATEEARGLQKDYETRLKAAQGQAHEAIQSALKDADDRRQVLLDQVKAEIAKEVATARQQIQGERERAVAGLAGDVGAFSELIKGKVLASAPAASLAGASGHQGGV